MPTTLIKTVRIGGNYTKSQLSTGNWNSTGSPLVLAQGQIAIEKDTKKGKWGDGVTIYSALDYVFYEGAGPGQVEVSITANPFTYSTGITTYIPKWQVYLKAGAVYTPWAADTNFNKTTGVITVNVDTGADSYVLVVG